MRTSGILDGDGHTIIPRAPFTEVVVLEVERGFSESWMVYKQLLVSSKARDISVAP